MKIGSLFTGYGGLDLAVEQVFSATTAWVSDISPGATKLTAHRYDAPNIGDITTVDWSAVEPVDIIAGGSPCQDVSVAGKRAGMTGETRSNLWAVMREGIARVRPTYVIWENVGGVTSSCAESESDGTMGRCPGCLDPQRPHRPNLRALGRVAGDLSTLGYGPAWQAVRASDVGSPHERLRIFLVAVDLERPAVAHPSGLGRYRDHGSRRTRVPRVDLRDRPVEWGGYRAAVERWQLVVGRPAPQPWVTGKTGVALASHHFAEWVMGLPLGWITDVPGMTRSEALHLTGNGVVPQQAFHGIARALTLLSNL